MEIRDLIIFGEIAFTAIAAACAIHFSQSKRIRDRESRIVNLEHDTDETSKAIVKLAAKMDEGLKCLHKVDKRLTVIEDRLDRNGFHKRKG